MKKSYLLLLLCALFCFKGNAQVNKLGWPSLIGWSAGWDREGQGNPATFTLENDGKAIKVKAVDAGTKMTGKFQQRFTPSAGGEYVLSFKAKAEIPGQNIKFHILRADAWKNLTNEPRVIIESAEYKDYTVNFTFDADVRDKVPASFIAVIFVDGVSGSLWFDDIKLYEKNNVLTTYKDDFEKDLSYGIYNQTINSWEVNGSSQELPTVTREKVGKNTVLKIKQKTIKADPWNVNVSRYWWATQGVKYRVTFDISSSINFDDFGIEIWRDKDKIRETERFPVTTEVKHMDFVTKTAALSEMYKVNLYAGKIPTNAEVYIDNVMISPIHLYNVEVNVLSNKNIEVKWLHAGYLAGDKVKVELVDGNNLSIIKDDVEIVDGKIAIELANPLVLDKNYTVKLTDKLAQKTFTVYNIAESKVFAYSIPEDLTIAASEIATYAAESLKAVKTLNLMGIWTAESLNTLQVALGTNQPQITVVQVALTDGESLSCSVTFTASQISYARSLSETLETICIPFAPSAIPQGIKLMEYTNNEDFDLNFEDVETMQPNVPYIISGTGNVEFSATDAVITPNPVAVTPADADYTYNGTFAQIAAENASRFFVKNNEGFKIADSETSVAPYRAYFTGESTDQILTINRIATSVSNIEEASNEIKIISMKNAIDIQTNKAQLIKIYSADGCLNRMVNLTEGSNAINLNKGLYIINNCKVVVR